MYIHCVYINVQKSDFTKNYACHSIYSLKMWNCSSRFFAKIRLHKKCMLCMSFNLFSENVKLFSPLFAKIWLHKKCMLCMSFNLFSENVELFSLLHNNKEYIRNPNCLLNVHVLKEKRWWILVLYNNTTEKCKTYNKVNDLPT